jgi:hypothetical protein
LTTPQLIPSVEQVNGMISAALEDFSPDDPVAEIRRFSLIGPRFAVAGPNDWATTISGRTVTVAPGTGMASGSVDTTEAPADIAVPANNSTTQYRYDLLVRRFDWTTDGVTTSWQLIPGTLGAAPPTTRSLVPGDLVDGLVAIVYAPANNGAPSLVDMRVWGGAGGPLVKATRSFLTYIDALPGTEVLVLDNAQGYGWQRYVYDGAGNWRAQRDFVISSTAFPAVTLTNSNPLNVEYAAITLAVPDPGYPYMIDGDAMISVGANTGVNAFGYARLDTTTGTVISGRYIRSGSLPNGELVTHPITIFSGELTGPHSVVITLARMTGTGNAITEPNLTNAIRLRIRPA